MPWFIIKDYNLYQMKVNILNQLRHVYNNLYQMKVNILNQLRHVYKQNIKRIDVLDF